MEVRVKGLRGAPVAEIEESAYPAPPERLCDFCKTKGVQVADWSKLHVVATSRICWDYYYVAVDASAILEATPDEMIIKKADNRLRRLPPMAACGRCKKEHRRRLRQELRKVGLLLL